MSPLFKKKDLYSREIPHKAFRNSPLFYPYKRLAYLGEYAWWRLKGSPGPRVPHLIKQKTIAEFRQRFGLKVMVETGTNVGNMINVQKDHFREIYSIENNPWYAARAKRIFAKYPHIHTYEGDSGKVLPTIMPVLHEPCLFWVDAHWGKVSAPIKEEMECIYRHPIRNHVLLIDDARWFDGEGDYYSVQDLRDHAAVEFPGAVVEVKDDIIRIYRPEGSKAT
jgi:hypothetical protein